MHHARAVGARCSKLLRGLCLALRAAGRTFCFPRFLCCDAAARCLLAIRWGIAAQGGAALAARLRELDGQIARLSELSSAAVERRLFELEAVSAEIQRKTRDVASEVQNVATALAPLPNQQTRQERELEHLAREVDGLRRAGGGTGSGASAPAAADVDAFFFFQISPQVCAASSSRVWMQ